MDNYQLLNDLTDHREVKEGFTSHKKCFVIGQNIVHNMYLIYY